jgi:hypothetical protein
VLRHLLRERGPREHHDARPEGLGQRLGDHGVHRLARVQLDALHGRDEQRVGVEQRTRARHHVPHRVTRHRDDHHLAVGERLGEVRRGANRRRELDVPQEARVPALARDRSDERGIARPERHVVAAVRAQDRETASEAPRPEHRDAHRHARDCITDRS